jgi:hypothetical protein
LAVSLDPLDTCPVSEVQQDGLARKRGVVVVNVLPRRDRNVVDSRLGMASEAYGLLSVRVDAGLTASGHVVVPPGQGEVEGVNSRNGRVRVVADLYTRAEYAPGTRPCLLRSVKPVDADLGRLFASAVLSYPSPVSRSLDEQRDGDYRKEKVKGELGKINPGLFGHVSDSP